MTDPDSEQDVPEKASPRSRDGSLVHFPLSVSLSLIRSLSMYFAPSVARSLELPFSFSLLPFLYIVAPRPVRVVGASPPHYKRLKPNNRNPNPEILNEVPPRLAFLLRIDFRKPLPCRSN